MMKNIKLILKTVLFVLGLSVNAQIASNNSINATINSESAFLDVSSSASTTNFAKGLGFPQTNLTTFSFVSVAWRLCGLYLGSYFGDGRGMSSKIRFYESDRITNFQKSNSQNKLKRNKTDRRLLKQYPQRNRALTY